MTDSDGCKSRSSARRGISRAPRLGDRPTRRVRGPTSRARRGDPRVFPALGLVEASRPGSGDSPRLCAASRDARAERRWTAWATSASSARPAAAEWGRLRGDQESLGRRVAIKVPWPGNGCSTPRSCCSGSTARRRRRRGAAPHEHRAGFWRRRGRGCLHFLRHAVYPRSRARPGARGGPGAPRPRGRSLGDLHGDPLILVPPPPRPDGGRRWRGRGGRASSRRPESMTSEVVLA